MTAMTEADIAQLHLLRSYLAALEAGATGDSLAQFFTLDAVQVEFPNRLNPKGGKSDLAALLARAEMGKKLLSSQSYAVQSEIVRDGKAAIEAIWTGTLAVPAAGLPAGAVMRARFAMFFELEKGRIRSQHNYDCFEPW